MSGTSDSEFSPSGSVSRADMAEILDGFLMAAEVDLDMVAGLGSNEDLEVDTPFSDTGSVSFAAYASINRLYEFGVAAGTTDTTFSPNALVSRAQMAVFVTRALAHTNARPAGLSIQAAPMDVTDNDATSLQVSLRDSDHAPVPDALIEVFSAVSADEALNDDGTCKKSANDPSEALGATRCAIDAADEATDPDGNVEVDITTTSANFCPGGFTFWAWSGEVGDTFDADDTDTASVTISVSKAATQLIVTSDMPEGATKLEYGDTLTVTFQAANADGDPVGVEGIAITVTTTENADGGDAERALITEHKTDASGRAEIEFTQDDPNPGKDNTGNETTLDLDLTSRMNADGTENTLTLKDNSGLVENDANAVDAAEDPERLVTWSDSVSDPTTLSISQSVAYHEASNEASGVRHTVQATLLDQYGDPVPGVKIRFWSNANNGDTGTDNDGLGGLDRSGADPVALDGPGTVANYADERTTNRRGVATKFYNRDSDASLVENISAAYNVSAANDTVEDQGTADTADDVTTIVYEATEGEIVSTDHYWASEATDTNDPPDAATLVAMDTDNNMLVVRDGNTNNVFIVTYDGNDQFSDSGGAVTLSAFESTLKLDDDDTNTANAPSTISVTMASDPGAGVNTLSITNDTATADDRCA